MAKNFLDRLGEAYEEDLFNDLIPTVKHKPEKKKALGKTSHARRRKQFMKNIEEALEGQIPKRMEAASEKKFLDAMEGALEDKAFDNVFPTKRMQKDHAKEEDDEFVPFQTAISAKILNRAKSIAIQKGIRIKDVINVALQWYLDKEYASNK